MPILDAGLHAPITPRRKGPPATVEVKPQQDQDARQHVKSVHPRHRKESDAKVRLGHDAHVRCLAPLDQHDHQQKDRSQNDGEHQVAQKVRAVAVGHGDLGAVGRQAAQEQQQAAGGEATAAEGGAAGAGDEGDVVDAEFEESK